MAEDRAEALATLKAMFPNIDYLEEVLDAHGGALEPALNTLLEISDPNYKSQDSIVPVQTESGIVTSTSREQLLRDEELARTLAAEADRAAGYGTTHISRNAQNRPVNTQQNSDFSFSDELPVIKEKIVNVADTTKKKVKEWYERLKQQTRPETDESTTNNPKYTNLPHNEMDNGRWEDDYLPVSQSNSSRQSGIRQIPRNSASQSPTTTPTIDGPIKIIRHDSDLSNTQDNSLETSPYIISDIDDADPERMISPKKIPSPRRYEVARASSAEVYRLSTFDKEELAKLSNDELTSLFTYFTKNPNELNDVALSLKNSVDDNDKIKYLVCFFIDIQTIESPFFKSDDSEGSPRIKRVLRIHLTERILADIKKVLISAPPFSGKTALAQLLGMVFKENGLKVIGISFAGYIVAMAWTDIIADSNNLLIADDAYNIYHVEQLCGVLATSTYGIQASRLGNMASPRNVQKTIIRSWCCHRCNMEAMQSHTGLCRLALEELTRASKDWVGGVELEASQFISEERLQSNWKIFEHLQIYQIWKNL
ncbi:11122_t:CDS:10 [Ambispora leptoticha]|uniref:11122_t:CDS:1 n=1 Tax=Ambispora leptoticha TaxID=144679 RepID=A0A9N8VJG2_9GLOM|nr:11122_t:CDS:10 [Ambispora leptoticha]